MEDVVTTAAAAPLFGYGDLAAAIFILVCVLIGLKRGLAAELARLLGAGAALIAAWAFHGPVAAWLDTYSRLGAEAARATAFVTLFVLALAATMLLRMLLRGMVTVTFAPKLERIGGAFAGLIRGSAWLVAIFAVLILVPQPFLNRVAGEECATGRFVRRTLPALSAALEKTSGGLPADDEPIEPPAEVY